MRNRARAAAIATAAAASSFVVLAVLGANGGSAQAAPIDQGDQNAQLAEAQFEVHLLTNTDLMPVDVTCQPPPATDPDGSMFCFALLANRETVAALARQQSPGLYQFVSVSKLDPPPTASSPAVPATPDSGTATPDPAATDTADEMVLAAIDDTIAAEADIRDAIIEDNPAVASLDEISYHAPTSTLVVTVTTTASTADAGGRDAIAFSITDILAYLWEQQQPLRDPAATILPRLEVTVDGTLYGSSYEMMVRVADYTMEFDEWLQLSVGGGQHAPGAIGGSGPAGEKTAPKGAGTTLVD